LEQEWLVNDVICAVLQGGEPLDNGRHSACLMGKLPFIGMLYTDELMNNETVGTTEIIH
jgi:hypothetical protein